MVVVLAPIDWVPDHVSQDKEGACVSASEFTLNFFMELRFQGSVTPAPLQEVEVGQDLNSDLPTSLEAPRFEWAEWQRLGSN